jgi:AraC-like DNA-binding protein
MNTLPEPLRLRQAVTNLLDNVCQYTRPLGRIQISLEAGAHSVELTVEGDGSKFVVRLPSERAVEDPKTCHRPTIARGGLAAWQLKRVVHFIHENLSQPISVVDIAAIAGQSASHFHRAFKRSVGTSVHLYIMYRRIEMAQQLMANTSEPLSAIAVTCGMCDQSHLTRWFTRLAGESPNRWRRAQRDAPEARAQRLLPDRHSAWPTDARGEL